jgi:tripartite-type tricarboxylate transporter receptor subunit TctC
MNHVASPDVGGHVQEGNDMTRKLVSTNQTQRRRFLKGSALAAGAVAIGASVPWRPLHAAEAFPTRPLSGIVSSAAGGGFDLLFRMVQPAWEKQLGRPIRPAFAPGAAGQIAVTQLLGQPADGHSFVLDAMTNLAVMIHYSRPEHFNLDSLAFIGTMMVEPVALLVRKDSRFTDIDAFMKEAREGTKPIKVGIGGNRVFYHLVAAAFKKEAKAGNLSLIIYPGGGGPSRTALLGGEVDAVVTGLFAASTIFDQVRGLVVFDDTNPIPKILPMATAQSLGFKLPATLHPNCIVVPAELQSRFPERFAILSNSFKAAMADPTTLETAKKLALPEVAIQYWDPARLTAYKQDVKRLLAEYGSLL